LSAANTSFVVYPRAKSCLLSSSTASSPYTYAGIANYPSQAALLAVAAEGRVIAAGVRVMSAASATNDNGLITIGCIPRDRTSASDASVTIEGFPSYGSTSATHGFNEFLNYLQTESYPLKQGASAFYRPQDPLDFTFRYSPVLVADSTAIVVNQDLQPFFVVGITNATTSQSVLFELVTHIEYTVSADVAGVINTGFGGMSTHQVTTSATSVFANAMDTSISGVVGGLRQLGQLVGAGSQLYRQLRDGSGSWMSSTDNANNLMLLD
jgi:hypothetical protein